MSDKAVRYIFITLSAIGALCLNNWALGALLNHELYSRNGSISEYSAAGQPHAWAFRLLDIVAGLALLGLAFLLANRLKKTSLDKFLMYSLAGLGLSSVLDAVFVLKCSDTLNSACNIPVNLSLWHYQMPAHAYSSVAEAIFYLVLPLAGIMYARAHHRKVLSISSWLLTIVAIASLISALVQYSSQGGPSVKASGTSQEVQVLLIGIWILILAHSLSQTHKTNALRSKNGMTI